MVLLHLLGGLCAVPLLLWVGLAARLRPGRSWLASMAIHFAYYIAVVGAYKHGDLGLTYPVMRGFAPLLVALCSVAVAGRGAVGGVVAGHRRHHAGRGAGRAGAPRQRPATCGKALAFAVANAAIIAAYTLVDGLGVRVSADAARYVLLLFVFDGIPYALLVWWQRSPHAAPRDAGAMHGGAGRWPRWAAWRRWARTASRCGP